MRTFWDMQQNQEIHKNADWQDKMVEIEMRVSDMDGYGNKEKLKAENADFSADSTYDILKELNI